MKKLISRAGIALYLLPFTAFSAHSQNTQTYTLFAAGDIADCRKRPAAETQAAKTAAAINQELEGNPHAYVLTLGDNTYPMGAPEEFSDCYDKTWGRFLKRTWPTPGNHDYGVPLALGYFNYFDELAGPERRGYFYKKLGNWLIFSLNSNIHKQHMQNQIAWLQQTLHDNPSPCILAYWHHPIYSSGGHGDHALMKPIWDRLSQAKADVVLSGHDHDYERNHPIDMNGNIDETNGIRSFIVGTGGAQLTPMFLPNIKSALRHNEHYGYLKLHLYERSYDWEFIAVTYRHERELGGKPAPTFTDRGKASCHKE